MRTESLKLLAPILGALILLIASLIHNYALATPNWSVVRTHVDEVLLLLPDNVSATDSRVTVWLDAAIEEGLHLRAIRDSDFIKLGAAAQNYAGVIMPDQVHIVADDILVSALRSYVSNGGKLMLVYDAGVFTSSGFYASPKSRFSDMVGVDYALYDSLRDHTIGFGHITGMRNVLRTLGVPPGKSMAYPGGVTPPLSASGMSPQYVVRTSGEPSGLLPKAKEPRRLKQPRESFDRDDDDDSHLELRRIYGPKIPTSEFAAVASADVLQGITGYYYGFLGYPSFVTQNAFRGTVLLTSPNHGLVAGTNKYGRGEVLFVNAPLGYLKEYGTDGLLLHGLLRHFAVDVLHQPTLAAVPKGTGGLVLNVHTDSGAALPSLAKLDQLGIWNNGPFSIDFTAGPDTISFGDGIGLNVPGNPLTQKWIRYLDQKGHQIGSHGGWIHDWFADNLTEFNQISMLQYLVLNKNALEAVTRKPVLEYSAPGGNMPKWVVDWAEQNGMLGYYFVGNTGMSATRSYREGVLANRKIWSFPLTPYGKAATFEEFEELGISAAEATQWFLELTDFAIQRHTARMVYFHPPGAESFSDSVVAWMARTAAFTRGGHFKWYTMPDLAKFLSARQQVSWQVLALADGMTGIEATHPTNLRDQTWLFPASRYQKPEIVLVNGKIVRGDGDGDDDGDDDDDEEDDDKTPSSNGVRVTLDEAGRAWTVAVSGLTPAIKSIRVRTRVISAN